MGQTLTHGIYLPEEGERNCYDGLAGNWQLLDGAVGTIAEHTTALSGKAPLVHTHTKSDVTDLFNSANSWTENNTYAKYILMKNTTVEVGNAPSNNTSKEISFTDKNNKTLSRLVGKAETSGNSCIFLHATNKYTNGALDPNGSARHSYFYVGLDATGKAYNKHAANTFPDANNTYDLGSSSYQWNNLYAKKVNTQSVNGINPGALSFPKTGTTENVDFINVLGNIDVSVTSAQTFVAPATGWFCISFKYDKITLCRISAGNMRGDCVPLGSDGYVGCYIPVTKGVTVTVRINATAIYNARIYLCQGNV